MQDQENNYFAKKDPHRGSDNFILKWGFASIILSLLIITAIVMTGKETDGNVFVNVSRKIDKQVSDITNKVNRLPMVGGKQNILVLGVDSNGKATDPFKETRSDTILIVNLDPFSKTVNVISVPRDSKVYISDNHGIGKINAAHALGGPELTKKTIEESLGIKINHYIVINYQGVKELVKAIGGVPINVEKRMSYVDRTAKLRINLDKGKQILDPEQAEQYLRFRHDALGDIGRMHRQKWFVSALLKKFQSPSIIPKIPEIVKVVDKYVRTDFSVYELSKYAAYAKAIKLNQIQTATLPGKPSQSSYLSYWILDPEKSQEVIDRLIYRDRIPEHFDTLKVAVLYKRKLKERADDVKALIEDELNYKVACMARTTDPHSQIHAHSSFVSLKTAKEFRKYIPELKEAQFILSPNQYLCGKADVTLILSDD